MKSFENLNSEINYFLFYCSFKNFFSKKPYFSFVRRLWRRRIWSLMCQKSKISGFVEFLAPRGSVPTRNTVVQNTTYIIIVTINHWLYHISMFISRVHPSTAVSLWRSCLSTGVFLPRYWFLFFCKGVQGQIFGVRVGLQMQIFGIEFNKTATKRPFSRIFMI